MNYLKKYRHLITLKNQTLLNESLLNCHIPGLHSFVLQRKPDGCLVRMFVATPEHLLWKNHCGHCKKGWDELSVGIHPHHVDITIMPIYGFIWNVEFRLKRSKGTGPKDFILNAFEWDSFIGTGRGGFRRIPGENKLGLRDYRVMMQYRKYHMRSSELHTVYVTRGQPAAWIIEETPASGGYNAITYSNSDLESWTPEGLYQKPSIEEIQEIFKEIDILL